MNSATESSSAPGWTRVVIAVSTAILVFRICRLAAGFIFFWIRGIRPLVPVAYFLQRWDYILVTGVSLIAAVLASRWAERIFLVKSRAVAITTSVALTLIALLPIEFKIAVKPVMVSPLEVAIAQHYPMDTVEALIDRYPRLVNGSVRPWYHYRPLVEAACDGRTNLVALLIRKGANVDEAVQELQQMNAEDAVRLVLQCVQARSSVTDEELRQETASRLSDAKRYCLGILMYAEKHKNMFPTNLDQTLPYLRTANRLPSGTNHFGLLYHGSLDELPNPMTNGIIVIRSDPHQGADGRWIRVYGFADGHCEAHSEAEDNFIAWEKEHSLHP